MNTKYLEYFVTLSRYQSMNEAAEALHISQPNLSYAIKALEDELGITLIRRSKTGIEITNRGMQILDDASGMLERIHKWKSLPDQQNEKPQVAIYGVGIISDFFLPYLYSGVFAKKFPNLDVEAVNHVFSQPLSRPVILDNRTMINIRFIAQSQYNEQSMLASRYGWNLFPIIDAKNYVLLNKDSSIAKKDRVTLSDIQSGFKFASNKALVNTTILPYYDRFRKLHDERCIDAPSREVIFRLIMMDKDVITVVSSFALKSMDHPWFRQLEVVELADYPMPTVLTAMYPINSPDYIYKLVNDLKDFIVKEFAS